MIGMIIGGLLVLAFVALVLRLVWGLFFSKLMFKQALICSLSGIGFAILAALVKYLNS